MTNIDHVFAFNSDDDDHFNHDTGCMGVMQLARAIQLWSWQQGELQSVAEAARVFRVPAWAVIVAVTEHPWMLLTGPTDDHTKLMIEHDGE